MVKVHHTGDFCRHIFSNIIDMFIHLTIVICNRSNQESDI